MRCLLPPRLSWPHAAILSLIAGLGPAAPGLAAGNQDMEKLRRAGADYLRQVAASQHPGFSLQVDMGTVDTRLRLPACPAPEFFLTNGSHPWGHGTLGARCETPAWNLYLSYQARLTGPALVARRPLAANQAVGQADVASRKVEIQHDPGLLLADLDAYRNAVLIRPLPVGAPLRTDAFRRPPAIRAGQRVRIVVEGRGFLVSQEGVAQQNAATGETVRLRVPSGRYVQGIAQEDGSVRIRP